ncbi:MAG: purine-binding chemotaxis protein CheW [Pseudomonadales bacterium]|nr:purine-binding chemotaxis protein CheW [Pseudomonadales bacterium]
MNAVRTKLSASERLHAGEARSLILFKVGELLCGIDVLNAQEINANLTITDVPVTDPYVRGVANLRGQVITVLDLRVLFGVEGSAVDRKNRVIVVRQDQEVVGLLVDRIVDILSATPESLAPPPANLSGVRGEYFDAVFKLSDQVAGILALPRVMKAG